MTNTEAFLPDWTSPPGETIADLLAERGLSSADLAKSADCAPESIEAVLAGSGTITADLARCLADVLGATKEFWISRESLYRAQLARFQELSSTAGEQWLRNLPLSDMVRFGWIERGTSQLATAIGCLRFFNTADIPAWHAKWQQALTAATFRSSPTFDALPPAVAAWLRKGELEAEEVECAPWDPAQFRALLPDLRALTRKSDPTIFLPELQRRCAACGVAVVVVRTPEGCRASGATRFASPEKAILMLSFRFLTDDHLWFTFFHEAAHLLLHSDQSIFLEGTEDIVGQREVEANNFAEEILVPPGMRGEMLQLRLDARKIIRFATQCGIAPGIVVGQLQHHRILTHRQMNELKRRYSWPD